MRLFFSICLIVFSMQAQSQTNRLFEVDVKLEIDSVTKDTTLVSLIIGQNFSKFEYPKAAIANNIQGKILLSYSLSSTCEIQNIKTVKSLGYGLDEIALQMLIAFGKEIKQYYPMYCTYLNGMTLYFPAFFSLER